MTNSVSNAIYGTKPISSAGNAFGRGFGAGAATSGINYLSDLLWQEPERSGAGGNLMAGMARGLTPQVGWMRDPRLGCGSGSPFVPVLGYSSARGYQYETPQTRGSQRRKFSMWDFFKEMATGGLTGGITSVAFYGTGKGIERLKESVQSGRGGSNPETTRVGRWMSQEEYDKMMQTHQVQMSGDNKVHVASPASMEAFGRQASKNSLYVEFDVPSNTISQGGRDGWSIINGPGSLLDRLYEKKGLSRITEIPSAVNIELKGSK